MNIQQAKQELLKGNKVTHEYHTNNQYTKFMKLKWDNEYTYTKGNIIDSEDKNLGNIEQWFNKLPKELTYGWILIENNSKDFKCDKCKSSSLAQIDYNDSNLYQCTKCNNKQYYI